MATQTVSDSRIDPNNAEAGIQFENGGILRKLRTVGNYTANDEWTSNQFADIGDIYEVRVTRTSGATLTTGEALLGSWLALTSTRTFKLLRSTVGLSQAVLSCTVRRTDLTASDTGSITLRAEVEDLS